ncbi:MAG: ABC transporter ATP-binding protein [Thermoplasmata archaeon]|nr:ABC transporter ATP-binding protein [Thermoplasmata archaeon]
MQDYVVEARGLVRRYGDLVAVDGLDFIVEKGEVYGLIGPNGSGKTTIIKLVCGLLKPHAGSVNVLGMQVPDPNISHQIGYMPQEIAIYPDLTVHDNVRFFGEVYGLSKKEIEKREEELLDFAGLTEKRDALASTLSGGLKHRLSFACTLVHTPKVLLLDEPTVGVDPELRFSFWEYFYDLRKKGVTTIITTHYMDEARKCTRVGLIRQGKMVAEDHPKKLMERTGTDSLEDVFLAFCRGEA